MSDFVIPVNFEDIPKGFALVPEGDYTLHINKAKMDKTQAGDKDRLLLDCTIVAPKGSEFHGARTQIGVNNEETSMWVFGNLLRAIVPADRADQIKGRKFKTENFEGKEFDSTASIRTFRNPRTGNEDKRNEWIPSSWCPAGALVNANTSESSAAQDAGNTPASGDEGQDW